MRKKLIVILLCLTLMISFTSCANTTSPTGTLSATGTIPDDQVLATVNGVEITGKDFNDTLNPMLLANSITLETFTEYYGVEQTAALKNNLLDEMISDEVLRQMAEELALTPLSEEELQSIEDDADEYFDTLETSLRSEFESQALYDPTIDVEAQVEEEMQAHEDSGYTRDYVVDQLTTITIGNKVYDHIMEDFSLTDEELQAYYDEQLQAQKDLAESDPETAVQNYLNGENDIDLYIPEGVKDSAKMIKHILIKIPDDMQEAISLLESNETSDEEAASEEDGTSESAVKPSQVLKDYALNDIRDEAEAVLAKVNSGEDFDTLIQTYGDDPGMESEENANGYLVYEGVSMVDEFVTAAMQLENVGDTSGLVASSYGYHILKYVGEPTTGQVAFEDVKDDIETLLFSDAESEYWSNQMAQWQEEYNVERVTFEATEAELNAEAEASASAQASDEPSAEESASSEETSGSTGDTSSAEAGDGTSGESSGSSEGDSSTDTNNTQEGADVSSAEPSASSSGNTTS